MSPTPLEERRPPITPQLAVRVALLGGFAFVLFAVVFFRLWFLQVLSGDDFVSQAAKNKVRKTPIEAPRGDIVDRSGQRLVKTRVAPVVQILPNRLPESETALAARYGAAVSASERRRLAAAEDLRELRRRGGRPDAGERRQRRALARAARRAEPVPVPPIPADRELRGLFRRLGRVIGVKPRTIHQRVIHQLSQTPYAAVTVKTDVSRAAYNYLRERASEFPSVVADKLYLRQYPHKTLGAQLFGTLREISPKELESKRYRGLDQGTRIGKDGVEETYDRYLRGTNGYRRQIVDAQGLNCDDCRVRIRRPRQGQRLRLTLDLGLQRAAEQAMRRAIAAAAVNGSRAGAYVAMNPRNGDVYALGSYPSFDANVFAKPLSQERYDALNSEESGQPLFNRALNAGYPAGSTFKLITATAALESGLITPETPITDDGSFELGTQVFKNAQDAVYGTITLPRALQVSSDVFFYILGNRMYPLKGQVLQTWARRLGIGRPTGIDLPGEYAGLLPDREWRDGGYAAYRRCIKRNGLAQSSQAALFKCGGIDRPYSAGDNVNLSVGQGDLQATPLQMAVAYSTVVNALGDAVGEVPRPHLGQRVEDGEGRLIQEIERPSRRKVRLKPGTAEAIMEGLRRAAMEGDGTSAHIFGRFPHTVYGKTGTVERVGEADQSWYVAYVEHQTRPIVVAVTIEKGGFGAETAAPAACRMLANWFDLGAGRCAPAATAASDQAAD